MDDLYVHSFGICTLMYAGVAILGYLMFGDSTLSQFTLNMPQNLVASKVAVWTTVCFTLSKLLHPTILWYLKASFMIFCRSLTRSRNILFNDKLEITHGFHSLLLPLGVDVSCLLELVLSVLDWKSHML